MSMQPIGHEMLKERGFTLVEIMISIVVAMVILAGILTGFVKQSDEYKYQNKRIDTSQDLEFGLKFIEEDLRGALVGGESIDINTGPNADPYTASIQFKVWDNYYAAIDRVGRKYTYDKAKKSLGYDRETGTASNAEILPRVTFFKVFDDYTTARAGFSDIPNALPQTNVPGPDGEQTVSGYTILIEMSVDIGLKGASPVDVRGNDVADRRIWRYIQTYPMAAVLAP